MLYSTARMTKLLVTSQYLRVRYMPKSPGTAKYRSTSQPKLSDYRQKACVFASCRKVLNISCLRSICAKTGNISETLPLGSKRTSKHAQNSQSSSLLPNLVGLCTYDTILRQHDTNNGSRPTTLHRKQHGWGQVVVDKDATVSTGQYSTAVSFLRKWTDSLTRVKLKIVTSHRLHTFRTFFCLFPRSFLCR